MREKEKIRDGYKKNYERIERFPFDIVLDRPIMHKSLRKK